MKVSTILLLVASVSAIAIKQKNSEEGNLSDDQIKQFKALSDKLGLDMSDDMMVGQSSEDVSNAIIGAALEAGVPRPNRSVLARRTGSCPLPVARCGMGRAGRERQAGRALRRCARRCVCRDARVVATGAAARVGSMRPVARPPRTGAGLRITACRRPRTAPPRGWLWWCGR